MKTTNFKDLVSNQKVVKPKLTYSNRLADGVATFMLVAGAALIIPAVGFLILGIASLIVPAAATLMLSISFSAVVAIEAAFVAGAGILTLSGWILAKFGTPDIEDKSTVQQESKFEAETASSNVCLPKAAAKPQTASQYKVTTSISTSVADTSSVPGLLELGQFAPNQDHKVTQSQTKTVISTSNFSF